MKIGPQRHRWVVLLGGSEMMDVVVGGSHTLFVDLLCSALTARGFAVVARGETPHALEEAVRRHRPRLGVLDLPDDAPAPPHIRRLAEDRTLGLVVLVPEGEEVVRAALEAGARGCLRRTQGVDELAFALRRVAQGDDPVALPAPPPQRPCTGQDVARRAETLTARERQCLELFVDGVPTARIVSELGISVTTVRSHAQSVLHKLGVRSRVEAVSLAVRHGLVPEAHRPAS